MRLMRCATMNKSPRSVSNVQPDWSASSPSVCPLKLGFYSKMAEPFGPAIPDAPEKARTPNLSVRSRTLYPIELLVHVSNETHYSTRNIFVNV